MQITGTLIKKGEVKTGTGQNGVWKKRSFIVKTNDQYPKNICLTAWNKVVDSMDVLSVGDEFTAHVNLESRDHNGNWYTEVKPLKIEGVKQGNKSALVNEVKDRFDLTTEEDDLPF